MVDIQSVAAEIRRGIKRIDRRRRKKPQGKNIMSASATQGGHNKCTLNSIITRHNTNTGTQKYAKLECGPMPNVMVALLNIGGALCSTPQSLADAHY